MGTERSTRLPYRSYLSRHHSSPSQNTRPLRIAPEFYRSRLDDAPATLALALLDGDAPIERPHLIVEPAILRVDVDERGRRALTESLFEVGFFVNGEFVSEEEQGYLPISWRLDPARYGPGEHVLTVNVTAFDGRVATASTRFRVAETERQDDE